MRLAGVSLMALCALGILFNFGLKNEVRLAAVVAFFGGVYLFAQGMINEIRAAMYEENQLAVKAICRHLNTIERSAVDQTSKQ